MTSDGEAPPLPEHLPVRKQSCFQGLMLAEDERGQATVSLEVDV